MSPNPNLNKKINNLRNTVSSLETSFKISKDLEDIKSSRFKMIKLSNERLKDNLEESEKRNTNMLNLFRYNATDELPQSLKIQAKKSWNQKYDALLKLNDQLRRQIREKDALLHDKESQNASLQQKLLDVGDKLTQREELINYICNKYINFKKRKNKEETLLRESIETLLHDALLEVNDHNNGTPTTSRMSLKPSKEALLAYETKRSDRLARENYLLRTLVQKIKINCHCHESSDSSSACHSFRTDN
ncbi:uncharacterized protein LOC103579562 [Microplitis demolitor]|uniref:uncharacterized protein LOC103579562 n=1 Tax=Microplitis demolitor TaxID=69319 RepID=UPI0004CD25D2|nr:uncharacterized protein LOC103579562 [Microplitis demolitor]